MGYCEFLTALLDDGRVTVPEVSPISHRALVAGDEVIAEHERLDRLEMPGVAPQFIASAGRWAGTRFFRACQFVVYRDASEQALNDELNVPYGEPISADVHYSVDLIFRYLPDARKLTSLAAEHDPLLDHLCGWARQWPLSSVGMSGIEHAEISGFEDNECLMRRYADRIIAKNDKTRLSHPAVWRAIRGAVGMFPELAEGLRDALSQYDQAASGEMDEAP